jgi:hypothetical protein
MVDAGNPVIRRDAAVAPPPDAAPAACATLPACLVTLNNLCPTTTPCLQRMANGVVNQCYPDNMGVKLSVVVAGQATTVTVVRAAGGGGGGGGGGAPCYTLTATRAGGMGGGGQAAPLQLSYSTGGGMGMAIATGTVMTGTTVVSAACGNQMRVNVPLNCLPGGNALLGAAGIGGMSSCTTVNAMMCTAP